MASKTRVLILLTLAFGIYGSVRVILEQSNKKTVLGDIDSATYRLAYLSTRDMECEPDQGPCHVIFDVVNVDGSNHRHLASGRFFPLFMESAPGGSYFAFVSPLNGPRNIFVVNATDGTITQVTSWPDMEIGGIGWSLDGKFIAFISDHDGTNELYVMTPDGTDPKRLTYGGVGLFVWIH